MNLTELTQECTEALSKLEQFHRILRDYERAHKLLDRIGVPRTSSIASDGCTGTFSLSNRITELGLWAQRQNGELPIHFEDRVPGPTPFDDATCMSKEQARALLNYLESGSPRTPSYNPVKRDEAMAIIRRIAESETPE